MAKKGSWSEKVRRDFDEREDYARKDRDESESAEARQARLDERGNYGEEMGRLDSETTLDYLMQLRNASPDDDVDNIITRLRQEYGYYGIESEESSGRITTLEMANEELAGKVDFLKQANLESMMREGATFVEQQKSDIVQDGEVKDFKDLWKEREG